MIDSEIQQEPLTPEEQFDLLIPKEDRTKIKGLIDSYLLEDKFARDIVIRINKKLELYYKGYQKLFWSAGLGDWNSPNFPGFDQASFAQQDSEAATLPDATTKIFNVYRGYGESVIAALSAGTPSVKFFPENADDILDISTSKAFSKIAKKIEKDNNSDLLFVKALYILWNQHFVAAYNYANQDAKYGFNHKEIVSDVEEITESQNCPNCGEETQNSECPNCGPVQPIPTQNTQMVQKVTGYEKIPKIKEIIEIYGSLNVQVPSWVFDIKSTPYVCLDFEIHSSLAKKMFPQIKDKIHGHSDTGEMGRWARATVELSRGTENQLVTLRRIWLRSWTSELLSNDDEWAESFQRQYPEGCLVTLVDDVIANVEAENLDEHWTFSKCPVSAKIYSEPGGLNMIDVQDTVNEVLNVETQTISYGIAETFADPEVINFRDWGKNKSQPGMLTPATPKSGQTLNDAFFQLKPATLSQEVDPFNDRLKEVGQFISGAYPAIYGGPTEGGSKTLGSERDSRAQALQRLSLTWKMLNVWWPEVVEKSTREFAANMQFDVNTVETNGDDFINVWVKMAEMGGNVGDVRSDSSEQIPVSWAQKRDTILSLIQLGDDTIKSVLYDPNNSEMIAENIGFGEIYIPGADDRNVQLEEIKQLVSSGPLMQPQIDQMTGLPMTDQFTGQPLPPIPMTSVPIQPQIDRHDVHIAVGKAWCNSAIGRATKQMNPPAYENVVLHIQAHLQEEQMEMMQQQMQEEQSQSKGQTNG